jgi:hypothetical protein
MLKREELVLALCSQWSFPRQRTPVSSKCPVAAKFGGAPRLQPEEEKPDASQPSRRRRAGAFHEHAERESC